MLEIGMVGGIVVLSWMSRILRLPAWCQEAWFVVLLVFVLAVLGSFSTGVGYHVALWRTLGARGALPKGWWWSPTQHHRLLRADERTWVLPWFYAGATSFVLVVLSAIASVGLALL